MINWDEAVISKKNTFSYVFFSYWTQSCTQGFSFREEPWSRGWIGLYGKNGGNRCKEYGWLMYWGVTQLSFWIKGNGVMLFKRHQQALRYRNGKRDLYKLCY